MGDIYASEGDVLYNGKSIYRKENYGKYRLWATTEEFWLKLLYKKYKYGGLEKKRTVQI